MPSVWLWPYGALFTALGLAGALLTWGISYRLPTWRRLVRAGMVLLAIGALSAVERFIVHQRIMPESLGEVGRLLSETALAVSGVSLVLVGSGMAGVRWNARGKALEIGVVIGVVMCMFWMTFTVLPMKIGRALGWGWYGVLTEVHLTTLQQVAYATGLRFPRGTALTGGVFYGGYEPSLVARLSLPARQVGLFLEGQTFQWLDVQTSEPAYNASVLSALSEQGWSLTRAKQGMQAYAAPDEQQIFAVVDPQSDRRSALYIAWGSRTSLPVYRLRALARGLEGHNEPEADWVIWEPVLKKGAETPPAEP